MADQDGVSLDKKTLKKNMARVSSWVAIKTWLVLHHGWLYIYIYMCVYPVRKYMYKYIYIYI